LDPLNPKQVSGGFGPNSELAMPDYIQPAEIEFYPTIPHGTISNHTISSTILGNSRSIRVYLPPSYATAVADSFPVVLFHDGLDYINLMKVNNVLDYLISENHIRPVIAVFVPPVNRDDEYAFNKTSQFESFIIAELMPVIDAQYRTRKDPASRAMIGSSYGGLISTQICYNRPQSFGLCAPFSPSYGVKNMEVYKLVVNGPKKEIKVYLDWGSYENEIMVNSINMRDNLIALKYEMIWNEWHEAHSCGNWRAHLDIALEYFFPATAVGIDDVRSKMVDVGCSIYPNPFKGSTTFTYKLNESTQVKLQIYNNLGLLVADPLNEFQQNGEHKLVWNAEGLPAGIYYCRLQAGNQFFFRKTVKIK
jgi:enterochelin esterase family protein